MEAPLESEKEKKDEKPAALISHRSSSDEKTPRRQITGNMPKSPSKMLRKMKSLKSIEYFENKILKVLKQGV